MRKQWIALLAALALALPLCAIPALAQTDQAPPAQAEQAEPEAGSSREDGEAGEEAPSGEEAGGGTIVAEPGETPGTAAGSTMDDELVFGGESDFRYLAFEDLRDRVLEGSLTAKMLEESIASIDATDYTKMYLELAAQLTSLEAAQSMYAQIPVASPWRGRCRASSSPTWPAPTAASAPRCPTWPPGSFSGTPPPPSGS